MAGGLPALQDPASWRVFAWLGGVGIILAGAAIAGRFPRVLIWTALLLCAEELIALYAGGPSAPWWALAFAILLFLGMESAYGASAVTIGSQPRGSSVGSLLPSYIAAAVAALVLSLVVGAPAVDGLAMVLTGFGAAAVIIAILVLLTSHARGSPQ